MKNMKLSVIISAICCITAAYAMKSLKLEELRKDFDCYKIRQDDGKGHVALHRMDLEGHQLTVTRFLEKWLHDGSSYIDPFCYHGSVLGDGRWCADLTSEQKRCLVIAACMHDLSKAGACRTDLMREEGDTRFSDYKVAGKNVFYVGRRNHELIAFYQVLHGVMDELALGGLKGELVRLFSSSGDKSSVFAVLFGLDCACLEPYRLLSGKPFDFKGLFDELHLTDEQRRELAVIIGAHKIMRYVYAGHPSLAKFSGEPRTCICEQALAFLHRLKYMAGLPDRIDRSLINCIGALTAADMCGVSFTVDHPVPSVVGADKCEVMARPFWSGEEAYHRAYCDAALPLLYQTTQEMIETNDSDNYAEAIWLLEHTRMLLDDSCAEKEKEKKR